jgi:DNA-binding NarL/FixJ family response regulator
MQDMSSRGDAGGGSEGLQKEIGAGTLREASAHAFSEAAEQLPPHKSRVLVVEDHPFVRQGLVSLVNRQPDLACCGETETVAATPALVAKTRPHLVLLDLQLKDADSFELIGLLAAEFPAMRIIVVSQRGEVDCAERVLRSGARGFVMKQDAAEELVPAVRAVLQGSVYVSGDLAGRLLHKLLKSNPIPALAGSDKPE